MLDLIERLKTRRHKDIYVAERTGKFPTSKGPIACARQDGYNVALNDILEAIEAM